MSKQVILPVHLIVNSDGEYAVGIDFDEAANNIGGEGSRKAIRLNVSTFLPVDETIEVAVGEAEKASKVEAA